MSVKTRDDALAAIDRGIRALLALRAVVEHRDPSSDAELPGDLFDTAARDACWVVEILAIGYGRVIDFADLHASELGKK